jgi:hypothetical protein
LIEELEKKLERHRAFIAKVHGAAMYTAPEVMYTKITDLVEGWSIEGNGNVPMPPEDEDEDEEAPIESVRDNGEINA